VRTYHYDDDSNRTSIDEQPAGGTLATAATYAYSTTAQDQLSSISASGTTSYGYDTDGNTTSYGTNTLTWNGNGMIATDAPTTSSSNVDYTYDPLGRLQERATTGPTADNEYIYAGTSDTPIMVTDGAGVVTESYVGGPLGTRRMFAGPPLTTSGTVTAGGILEMPNGLGNQAVTVDGSATRLDTYTYDAFGAPNDATPSNTLADRYLAKNGRPLDTATGLILMGARPYDSASGRFLSVDPVDGGSANVYDYADQDPVDESDPAGTSAGMQSPENYVSMAKRLQPRTLSGEEEAALQREADGTKLPGDDRLINSARQKGVFNEKNGYTPDGRGRIPVRRNNSKRLSNIIGNAGTVGRVVVTAAVVAVGVAVAVTSAVAWEAVVG
jgi:RHS repeat-associated protein